MKGVPSRFRGKLAAVEVFMIHMRRATTLPILYKAPNPQSRSGHVRARDGDLSNYSSIDIEALQMTTKKFSKTRHWPLVK